MKFRTTIAVLLLSLSAMPALAQSRFEIQAREAAERRAEHKAIRELENPETVAKPTPTAPAAEAAAPAAPAEAAPAAQAQVQPAEPAPATPAR